MDLYWCKIFFGFVFCVKYYMRGIVDESYNGLFLNWFIWENSCERV